MIEEIKWHFDSKNTNESLDSRQQAREVRIEQKPSGPIRVQGEVKIFDSNGQLLEHGERFSLCGCGKSRLKPFCDGSHKPAANS